MINKYHENLEQMVIKLTMNLSKITYQFFVKELKEDHLINDVLNVIFSSHVSSLLDTQKKILIANEEDKEKIEKYIKKILRIIKKLTFVKIKEIKIDNNKDPK